MNVNVCNHGLERIRNETNFSLIKDRVSSLENAFSGEVGNYLDSFVSRSFALPAFHSLTHLVTHSLTQTTAASLCKFKLSGLITPLGGWNSSQRTSIIWGPSTVCQKRNKTEASSVTAACPLKLFLWHFLPISNWLMPGKMFPLEFPMTCFTLGLVQRTMLC